MQPLPGSAEFPNDNPLLHQGAVWICTRVRGAPRAILRASLPPPEPELAPVFVSEPVPEPEPVPVPAPVPERAPVPVFVSEPVLLPEPEAEPAAAAAEPMAEAEPAPIVVPEGESVPVAELSPEPEPEPELAVVELPPTSTPVPAVEEDPFADYVKAIVEVVLEAGSTRAAAAIPALLEGACAVGDDFESATIDRLIASGIAERRGAGVVSSSSFRTTVSVWQRVLRGEPADLSECGAAMLDQWTADFVATLLGTTGSRSDDLRRQLRRKGVAAFGMLARAA